MLARAESPRPRYALYLAVLPNYRQACVDCLDARLADDVRYYVGDRHLVPTVRTGVMSPNLRRVRNHALIGRRVLFQVGHLREAFGAEALVTDLNPRSLTAWALLVGRRARGRRTLVWGHLHPRAGRGSRTAPLRDAMRHLADGFVAYDYASLGELRAAEPERATWVAPNALYRSDRIAAAPHDDRRHFLYVGRLVAEKSVDVLVRGFAQSGLAWQGARLQLVGAGPEEQRLRELASSVGVAGSVDFEGEVYDSVRLADYYARAVRSVSPGYAGLSITQSLGFGVVILVSRDEEHAPEIELAASGGVHLFDTGDPAALAAELRRAWEGSRSADPRLSDLVREHYSAERMADGLIGALQDAPVGSTEVAWHG